MAEDRYELYGFVPSEHSDFNEGLSPSQQKIQKPVKVYSTNDQQDAEYVIHEGGFVRDGQWFAVVGGIDKETGVKIGNF